MSIFEFWPALFKGLGYTLLITISSFVIGLLIAGLISAARRSRLRPIRFVGAAYVEILRGVPPIPWLFLVFFALPTIGIRLSPVASGILVFSLIAGAYLSEIYRSGLRAVHSGQLEATDSLGLSRRAAYIKVIIPQAVRSIFPQSITYLIGLLKDSALVSMIGVQDITTIAVVEGRNAGENLTAFISAALMYLAISIPVGVLGRKIEERLKRRKRAKKKVAV